MSPTEEKSDIGVIGLAVMGQNLILNMTDHGFKVSAFNRTVQKVDNFISENPSNQNLIATHSIEEFVDSLKAPKKIMLMVKAGEAVDQTIEQFLDKLSPGDIIIDGGNSNYQDTVRRVTELKNKGILYIGTGISGGEEGARKGPSIMPGGSKEAWPEVKPIFQSIAAKVDDGTPCCDWVGEGGAGHYVKMVHNGIEYGDMQIIAEAYALLKKVLKLNNEEIAEVFNSWNTNELESYLIEITAAIFKHKNDDGKFTIDTILDSAGQKGTGKWTVIDSAERGQPLTLISEAVYARCLSSLVDMRRKLSNLNPIENTDQSHDKLNVIKSIKSAVYSSKIISYTQGFMLIKQASDENSWNIDLGSVALMWRGGCIIRSSFLNDINEAYTKEPKLDTLLANNFFLDQIKQNEQNWRDVVKLAIDNKVAIPAISSALAFYDGSRTKYSPANLIQAQRDFFGAHTYQTVIDPSGEFIHTDWTGHGGKTSSSAYQV